MTTRYKSIGDRTVQVGVLGCGLRLRQVMHRLMAIGNGRVRVAAVYDPVPGQLEAARELLGSEVALCGSEDDLFSFQGLDWVIIASPNHLHANHVLKALDAGLNVFCEKPLATDFEDCLLVRDRVRESGKVFAFGLVLRYSPFYRKIKEIVESGDLGEIVSFEFNETLDFDHGGGRIFSTWRRNYDLAGSHLLEKCCHDLDLANWLIGSLPVKVASFGGRDFFTPDHAHHVDRVGPAPGGRRAYHAYNSTPDVVHPFSPGASIVDNQVAILQYENGVRATFHTNCNTAMRERRFYLCGTEGTLKADAYTGEISWRRIGYGVPTYLIKPTDGGGQGHAGGDDVMAANLLSAMCGNGELLASVDDGIRACVTAFAIDEAMEQGTVIDLKRYWARCDTSREQTSRLSTRQEQHEGAFSERPIPVSSAV